ncbi:MAG TPA: hypothetical protein VFH41_06385 [Bradyrhizobium sp.]|nr:hypothetical protein [Bradyrhizobium sp.]
MTSTVHAFHIFTWFLAQSVIVGGIGSEFFWSPLLALIVGLAIAWKRMTVDRRPLWILFLLPALWIFSGLLGGYYWMDWARAPVQYSPGWVLFALKYSLLAFFLVGLLSIIFLRGARWFATLCFVINLYFMITMTLLSSMAVTGDWL